MWLENKQIFFVTIRDLQLLQNWVFMATYLLFNATKSLEN